MSVELELPVLLREWRPCRRFVNRREGAATRQQQHEEHDVSTHQTLSSFTEIDSRLGKSIAVVIQLNSNVFRLDSAGSFDMR